MAAHLQYIDRYLLACLYQLTSKCQAIAPIIAFASENGKAIAVGQMLLYPLKKAGRQRAPLSTKAKPCACEWYKHRAALVVGK